MTQMGFHAMLVRLSSAPGGYSPAGIGLIADLATENEFPSS